MASFNMNDDDSWTPPSEAEQKVLEARRERNNKISSLMGQYLLRGYKMLAVTCRHCDCILMEDRQKTKYCIACSEVDADNKKDNPAVNDQAARRTVEESQHRCTKFESPITDVSELAEESRPNADSKSSPTPLIGTTSAVSKITFIGNTPRTEESTASIHPLILPHISARLDHGETDFSQEVLDVVKVLKMKLGWASKQLQTTTSVQDSQQLVKLISETISALSSIRALCNT